MKDPKMFSMEWCMKMAGLEGDAEIGAGKMARDPFLNPAKAGTIFHDHTCYRCSDGELPCPHKGKERNCDTLRARND